MTDITKCNHEFCPQKDKCYRYTAKSGFWQSYFMTPPFDLSRGECEYFWDNHKEDNNDNSK